MPEDKEELGPAAISYKDVLKGHDKDEAGASEAWRKIGDATGAGHVYPGELASIDLTNSSQAVRDKVAKLAAPEKKEDGASDSKPTPVSNTTPGTTPGIGGPSAPSNAPSGGNS